MGAETHLGLVHREVGDAAAKREQLLTRIAVFLVLPDRVVHRLLGEVVLQLEGDDRQAVDEERDVERPLRFVSAIAKLSGHGEAVPLEAVPGLLVAGRRCAVEQVEVVRAVLDTVAQHLDRAPLGNLALQPRQKLAPCRTVLLQRQSLGRPRLGVTQEGSKLDEIDAPLAVVVEVAAAAPAHPAVAGRRFGHGVRRRRLAGMAGQRRADEALEARARRCQLSRCPPSVSDRDFPEFSGAYRLDDFLGFLPSDALLWAMQSIAARQSPAPFRRDSAGTSCSGLWSR